MLNTMGLGEVKTKLIRHYVIHYLAQGSGWRFDTLLEKEPETIEWIDQFRPGETLWDIGANVGIYAIYAAKRGIKVVAFEPHFANYLQLCINIMLNGLQEYITPFCLAFTDTKAVSTINLASIEFGTSMSSFNSNLDFRGNPYMPVFKQGMIGYDIDSFLTEFNLTPPSHFKIDVDGIELAIVRGATKTFSESCVKSVSIELIDSDQKQIEEVNHLLTQSGLRFIHKKQNPAFATPQTIDVMNFLYCR